LIRYLEHLSESEQAGVLALIASATNHDGIPPIAEHIVLHLRHGGDKDDRHLVLTEGDKIVGYAHIDLTDAVAGSSAELVVCPEHRGRGYGRALLDEITRITSPRLWSHGDLENARKLATERGFKRVRTVIQMRRSLEIALPKVEIAEADVEVRSFLPDLDDSAWLDLNNRVFEGHPEQGNWSLDALHNRMKENWFDPSGFLLATQGSSILAFCWTKIHGAHTHSHGDKSEHGHDPIGEIYAMGVDPAHAGKGLGRTITIAGLSYLRYQGLNSAMLYVDAENESAIRLYKNLGFTEWGRDVMYKKVSG
jgi:mycothiol synthase